MDDPDRPDIDQRLRDAFRVDAADSGRVARAALAGERARLRRSPYWWPALAAASFVVAVAVASMRPQPGSVRATPATAPPLAEADTMMIRGSIDEGALIVQLPDGSTSISWGGARENRPPEGSGIVIVEGAFK